ncbi:ABC transporter permease [Peptoniphilus obesi]|uniref:ABC transporter permease n=1 Tax=Peptoniphilus obesi TaxID=1472765 RepID=UPI0004B8EF3E|nr:ABC transporter permease [Peptoniphilus obesi]
MENINMAEVKKYKKRSPFSIFLKKLLANKLAIVGFVIMSIIVIMAIFAPIIAPYDPNEIDVANSMMPPGYDGHIFGTDSYGRDLFSRILYGSRVSLIVGVAAILVGCLIGVLLGLIAGYFGGTLDSIIMRIMDAMFAFPFILLAITLMMVFGSGLFNTILAIAIGNIPGFARITRGQVLAIKEEDYIEVTESLGAKKFRIIFSHILPNAVTPIIVYGTMSVAGAIISEAALSYLGLGIAPPTASWGSILQEGKDYLVLAPHISIFPGLAIVLSVLGINLFGDALRDVSDPKSGK